jgi:hypothetical protein
MSAATLVARAEPGKLTGSQGITASRIELLAKSRKRRIQINIRLLIDLAETVEAVEIVARFVTCGSSHCPTRRE